ncbi:MAG: CoB--CoM heterodisulfide reductase iron-sulfur subunit A family protein [Candidatus Riflebacteria bacterium]|nr:CoB--CoM heterodisulfide reductase iron-sulfur subunit A family protein [Candidatus Riflebacteria bacterium]
MTESTRQPILVVGAGIAGVSAALEVAETGHEVLLVERDPSIGGRVLRSFQYFPKFCPPSCGMEINIRRFVRNPRVRVMTNARVVGATCRAQSWSVTISKAPAYVNDRCTACGECSKVCPTKVADGFNLKLVEVPAIRPYHLHAWPRRYVLDRKACSTNCKACVDACTYSAIDLAATEQQETLEVSAVIVATGWDPYPIERLSDLGGGVFPDVIANVMLERLASPSGPTGGKILRPSDRTPPKKVAFVQCAGSRDVNHLAYCSGVCCLDRRTPGRNEKLLTQASEVDGVKLVKGKVGRIERDDAGTLVLRVEDVESGRLLKASADLVVLATGMMPGVRTDWLPFALKKDDDGFAVDDPEQRVFVAGVTRRPEDVAASVRDATGAAARALAAAFKE